RKVCGEDADLKREYVKPLKKDKSLNDFFDFAKDTLKDVPHGDFVLFGSELYLVPEGMLTFDKLKVVRAGWHLGTFKKNRFEPSHALALSLLPEDVKHYVS
ncbi:RNA methyltransferase, partial [Acinetobacter baumannii]